MAYQNNLNSIIALGLTTFIFTFGFSDKSLAENFSQTSNNQIKNYNSLKQSLRFKDYNQFESFIKNYPFFVPKKRLFNDEAANYLFTVGIQTTEKNIQIFSDAFKSIYENIDINKFPYDKNFQMIKVFRQSPLEDLVCDLYCK